MNNKKKWYQIYCIPLPSTFNLRPSQVLSSLCGIPASTFIINNTTTATTFTYNFCGTEEFWVHSHMDHPCLFATANLVVILAFPPGKEQEKMELQHSLRVHSIISSVFFFFNILLQQNPSILTHMRNVNFATKIFLNFKSIYNLKAPDLSFIKVRHLRNGLGICALTQWSSPHVGRPSPQTPSRCAPPPLLQQSHLACPAAASSTWPGRDRDRDSKD